MRGFTLIETIVAIGMFSLLVGAVAGIFTMALRAQQQTLAQQEVTQNAAFLMEYLSRSLRDAQKDLGPTCLTGVGASWTPDQTTPQRGWNYQVFSECPGSPLPCDHEQKIRFIDRNDKCREFRTVTAFPGSATVEVFEERVSSDMTATFGAPKNLLAGSIDLRALEIRIADNETPCPCPPGTPAPAGGWYQGDAGTPDRWQPRISFGLDLGSQAVPGFSIISSTTVTQRILDVQK